MNRSQRKTSIELLRILIMIMIIGSHFSVHGFFSFSNVSISMLWLNIISMGGNLGVVVFVIISGYFLIENNSLKTNFIKTLKLIGIVYIYSILLLLLSLIINNDHINKYNILNSIFPISNNCWWFATSYLILYIEHPLINKFLLSINRKQYEKYLIFVLVLFSLIPNITITDYSFTAIEFVIYYSIGGYIRTFGLLEHNKRGKWLKWFIILSIIKCLICIIPNFISFNHDWISTHFYYVYNRNSIFTIIQAVCLFMTFLKMDIKYNGFINRVASATFGVYLIHDSNLLRPIIWQDIFKVATYQDTALIIPYSIVVTLIVFICCSVIDLIRQIVFEKPYMKLVDKISPKIEIVYNRLVDRICKILD